VAIAAALIVPPGDRRIVPIVACTAVMRVTCHAGGGARLGQPRASIPELRQARRAIPGLRAGRAAPMPIDHRRGRVRAGDAVRSGRVLARARRTPA
jgi:hypothetical protein